MLLKNQDNLEEKSKKGTKTKVCQLQTMKLHNFKIFLKVGEGDASVNDGIQLRKSDGFPWSEPSLRLLWPMDNNGNWVKER